MAGMTILDLYSPNKHRFLIYRVVSNNYGIIITSTFNFSQSSLSFAMEINSIIALIVGLLTFGEALLLFTASAILKKIDGSWLTTTNRLILLSDIAVGGIILNYALGFGIVLILPFVIIGIVTHVFRSAEYFYNNHTRFLFNKALFAVNMVKLLGLFVVFGELI